MEQKDSPAGGRDVIEKGKKGGVGWLAQTGVGRKGFEWGSVKGLPAMSAFEVREGDARGDAKGPGVKHGGFAQEGELAEDLDGCLLENVVREIGASQTTDVMAQRRVAFTEKLFQGGPVAGLGE
jgi:hypothetical protein